MKTVHPPRPLSAFDATGLRGVLTDIDDTLTTDGRLEPDAYAALWALHRAGLHVVPVTGRSAGWAHMVLKTWPVDAVVAESGGLYLSRDDVSGRVERVFHDTEARVAADRTRLAGCADAVLRAVPGLAPASDNAFRLVDLALDYCEEVPRVAPDAVAQAVTMFRAAGFSARCSSVHVNAWAGRFDKAPMALRCLRERFAQCADPSAWAFIGDAPNDASMFEAFARGVGVANVLDYGDALTSPPRHVTTARSGAGFAEFARHVLAAR